MQRKRHKSVYLAFYRVETRRAPAAASSSALTLPLLCPYPARRARPHASRPLPLAARYWPAPLAAPFLLVVACARSHPTASSSSSSLAGQPAARLRRPRRADPRAARSCRRPAWRPGSGRRAAARRRRRRGRRDRGRCSPCRRWRGATAAARPGSSSTAACTTSPASWRRCGAGAGLRGAARRPQGAGPGPGGALRRPPRGCQHGGGAGTRSRGHRGHWLEPVLKQRNGVSSRSGSSPSLPKDVTDAGRSGRVRGRRKCGKAARCPFLNSKAPWA